jgi:hypothetical protein
MAAGTGGKGKQWQPLSERQARLGWYLSHFPKISWNFEFKMDTFHCSKDSQILHEARMVYSGQLSQLCLLLIPNRIHVINLGTYSDLNHLWILKGFKPSGKIWEIL